MIRSADPAHIAAIAALDAEWWTLAELEYDIARGYRQLWEFPGGVAMTRMIGGTLFVEALIGEGLEAWGDEFQAAIVEQAREWGCTQVACRGRRGWARFARDHGWRETHREYRLEVGA